MKNKNYNKISLIADEVYETSKYRLYKINTDVYIDKNGITERIGTYKKVYYRGFDIIELVGLNNNFVLIDYDGIVCKHTMIYSLNERLKSLVNNILTTGSLYKRYKSNIECVEDTIEESDLIQLHYRVDKNIAVFKININYGYEVLVDIRRHKILSDYTDIKRCFYYKEMKYLLHVEKDKYTDIYLYDKHIAHIPSDFMEHRQRFNRNTILLGKNCLHRENNSNIICKISNTGIKCIEIHNYVMFTANESMFIEDNYLNLDKGTRDSIQGKMLKSLQRYLKIHSDEVSMYDYNIDNTWKLLQNKTLTVKKDYIWYKLNTYILNKKKEVMIGVSLRSNKALVINTLDVELSIEEFDILN